MMTKKKILFVCVENAGRSQMAEAFFRKYLPSVFEPVSAGTMPAAKINPTVAQAMKEIGIDIEKNSPQSISQEMIVEAKTAVNMGCMDKEACPALFLRDVIDWQIEDPKGKSIEEIRKIRDQIEQKIKELILQLEKS